jgi:hypothetical protein
MPSRRLAPLLAASGLVALAVACGGSDDSVNFVDPPAGQAGANAGGGGKGGASGKGGAGGKGGKGGTSGKGGEAGADPDPQAGQGGSDDPGAGAGGDTAGGSAQGGSSGSDAGTGGSGESGGSGGSEAGSGGSGGTSAGTGGVGGSNAGTGGSNAGTGGSNAGTGGSSAGTGGSSAGTGGSAGAPPITECSWQTVPAWDGLGLGKVVSVTFSGDRIIALVNLPNRAVTDVATWTANEGWKLSPSDGTLLRVFSTRDGHDFRLIGDTLHILTYGPGTGDGDGDFRRKLSGGAWSLGASFPPGESNAFDQDRIGGVGALPATPEGDRVYCSSTDDAQVYATTTNQPLFTGHTPLGAVTSVASAGTGLGIAFFGFGYRFEHLDCTAGYSYPSPRREGAFYDLKSGLWGSVLSVSPSDKNFYADEVIGLDGSIAVIRRGLYDQPMRAYWAKPSDSAFTVRELPVSLQPTVKQQGFFRGTIGGLGKRIILVYHDDGISQLAAWNLETNVGEPLCPPPAPFDTDSNGGQPVFWNGPIGPGLAFIRQDLSGAIVTLP